jgi:putative hydrolase of the HAD superfamily
MVIRAVIFDIGGVLEITEPTGWGESWARRLDLSWAEIVARLAATWEAGELGAIDLAGVECETMALLGISEIEMRQFMSGLWTEYLGRLNRELADYFASLRPRYRTGILSNSFVGARELEGEAYGFEELCDVVVYSHEEGLKKPDPRFYEVVLERLGVLANEAVFVDDSPVFVEAARKLAMSGVVYIDNRQVLAELEDCLGRARGGTRWRT